ncbi:type II toxin-antitoxin system RelE/ParE family toxin [Acidiferrobacter thiooxydans]|uniref:type II toxin-antitoxin system RelE/ParE family toxin n=1 Tax=Acidiferrobacter thiooxydans TaxID=163359 RepID=UPI003B976EA7|nr:type II toxin-antitoxin system RelE/ParE family toxin [Acidiferrobacter thiooxydans]
MFARIDRSPSTGIRGHHPPESAVIFIGIRKNNERANIDSEELGALKDLAADLLVRTARQLSEAAEDGSLQEICHDNQT